MNAGLLVWRTYFSRLLLVVALVVVMIVPFIANYDIKASSTFFLFINNNEFDPDAYFRDEVRYNLLFSDVVTNKNELLVQIPITASLLPFPPDIQSNSFFLLKIVDLKRNDSGVFGSLLLESDAVMSERTVDYNLTNYLFWTYRNGSEWRDFVEQYDDPGAPEELNNDSIIKYDEFQKTLILARFLSNTDLVEVIEVDVLYGITTSIKWYNVSDMFFNEFVLEYGVGISSPSMVNVLSLYLDPSQDLRLRYFTNSTQEPSSRFFSSDLIMFLLVILIGLPLVYFRETLASIVRSIWRWYQ